MAPTNTAQYGDLLAGADGFNFKELSAKLPTARDPDSTARRKKLFNSADVNGNGYLSRAEVDKAVGSAIGSEHLFSAKPVIARAFEASKDLGSGKNADYVRRRGRIEPFGLWRARVRCRVQWGWESTPPTPQPPRCSSQLSARRGVAVRALCVALPVRWDVRGWAAGGALRIPAAAGVPAAVL